jgi:hypothetical protein
VLLQTKKYTIILKVAAPTSAVTIITPINNSSLSTNSSISITADATVQNSAVDKVLFFADNTKIGEDVTMPYHCEWSNIASGTYNLTAKAVTTTGDTTVSAPVQLFVSSILPVSLVSFTVTRENSAVRLLWLTASERKSSSFRIQRSVNAIDYIQIGSLPSQGNSDKDHRYTWLDMTPLEGISYYRLQQIDNDNSSSYSPVVLIDIAASTCVNEVYPSPACCYIVLPYFGFAPIFYRIFNSSSKTLMKGVTTSGAAVPVESLEPGLYYIEMKLLEQRFVRKFIKI